MICSLYAWFEAVKEIKRCLVEIHRGTGPRMLSTGHNSFLAMHWPFSWFGVLATPKTVIYFEVVLRGLFIFFCGLFNGAVSLLFFPFLVPAVVWLFVSWFFKRRGKYSTMKEGDGSDGEYPEETEGVRNRRKARQFSQRGVNVFSLTSTNKHE